MGNSDIFDVRSSDESSFYTVFLEQSFRGGMGFQNPCGSSTPGPPGPPGRTGIAAFYSNMLIQIV